jgi:serine/threonine protein kinase/tetratricopeptide (TPR) repeat protein
MDPIKLGSSSTDVTLNDANAEITPARIVSPTASGAAAALARTNSAAILEVGTVLAGRFEILEMLGIGGMGAVYKAHDRDIDRTIALKCIRPDLSNHPEVIQRFKQEMLLARQIAHKNVIRIFDVRESGGLKFITMEYVVGKDLGRMLAENQKLPPSEALEIMQQVCAGLAAAHGEGVLHRDLKPSNIMRDAQGRVVVMDFGLARTVEGDGMTGSGVMLGTMEYMSPEQAKAEPLDARSDLFTVGLILYELLTGKMPYQAGSAMASLVKRTQERATPACEVNPEISSSLSAVVSKCLERDPAARYSSIQELILELDAIQGKRPSSVFPATAAVQPTRSRYWAMAAIAVLLVAISATVWFARSRPATPQATKTVTLLVADFDNGTSDPVFDGSLESSFALGIEGASFINSYNRGQARKTIGQLKPGSTVLNEADARLVAVREGIEVVVSGSVQKDGQGYKIACKAIDAVTGKTIGSAESEANDKAAVLQAMGSLASRMRRVLGDTSSESKKLAQAETYTSNSLEALHDYASGQEERYAGKSDQAIQSFLKAISLDADFGSAYAGLAAMYANQGQREAATKYYKLALEHLDRMTDREKYRARGGYYLATMDAQKAVDEFTSLVQQYPADSMGHSSLGFAYYLRQDMNKALEEGRRALETYPKNVPYRNNVALYAIYAGDFQVGEQEGRKALEMNPAYLKAYISVALSQIGLGRPDEAAETYRKLQSVSALGASFGTNGLADLALYKSRPQEAADLLQKGIADDLVAKNNAAAAKKMVMLAEALFLQGQKVQALAALDRAVSLSKSDVLFPAARLYAESGEDKKASALAGALAEQLEPLPQAYAKIVSGEIELRRAHAKEAIKLFQDAQNISNTWMGHFKLAQAYIEAGAFPQADSELSECLKRRGEATDIYSDEVQSFHFFPTVYYYTGRVREGLKSGGAVEAYRTFLQLKAKDAQDPLVTDARDRLAKM